MKGSRPQIDEAGEDNYFSPLPFPRRFFWPPLPPVGGEGGEAGGAGANGEWPEKGGCGEISIPYELLIGAAKADVGEKYSDPAPQPDGSLTMWAYRWICPYADWDSGTWGLHESPTIISRLGAVGGGYDSMLSLCEGTIYQGKKYSPQVASKMMFFPPNDRYKSYVSAYKKICGTFWRNQWCDWCTWEEYEAKSLESDEGGYTECVFCAIANLYAGYFIYPRYYLRGKMPVIGLVPTLLGLLVGHAASGGAVTLFSAGGQATPARKRKRKTILNEQ